MTAGRAAAVAAAAAFAVSLGGLGNAFVIDDRYLIVENPAVHDLGNVPGYFGGWWGASSQDAQARAISTRYYRPLAVTVSALQYALFGLRPAFFHLVSGLLHATTAALVALIVFRASGGRAAAALIGGLLFAVHPVQAEPLAAAAYQTTLLAGLLGAAALLLFGRMLAEGVRARTLLPMGLALLAGCLAKEDAFAVPLLAAAWALVARPPGWPRVLAAGGAVMAGAVAIVLGARAAALTASSPPITYFGDAPAGVVALTMLRVVALYAELLLVPLRLCPFYDWFIIPFQRGPSPEVLLGAGLVAIAVGTVLVLGRRRSPFGLGIAWLCLGLLPVSQVIPFIVVAAERFLYLPMLGWALALGVAGAAALDRVRRAAPRRLPLAIGALSVVLAAYAARTVVRFADWRDDGVLNRATARTFPETPTPLLNLADFHARRGETAEAVAALEEAIRRAPGWRVPIDRLAALRARGPGR